MGRITGAPLFKNSNSPVRTQAVIGQRAMGQIGTAPETQFSTNYWQKRGTKENKENSFEIPDTLLNFFQNSKRLIGFIRVKLDWVDHPHSCSLSEVQRVARWVSDKVVMELSTQAVCPAPANEAGGGHGRVEKAHISLPRIILSGILKCPQSFWSGMFSH